MSSTGRCCLRNWTEGREAQADEVLSTEVDSFGPRAECEFGHRCHDKVGLLPVKKTPGFVTGRCLRCSVAVCRDAAFLRLMIKDKRLVKTLMTFLHFQPGTPREQVVTCTRKI